MTVQSRRLYTSEQIATAVMRFRTNYQTSAGLLMHFSIAVSALDDPDLDNGSRRVLAAIMRCANYEDGEATVDRSSIAMMTGLSEKSVTNKLSALKRHGYVANVRFSLGQGMGTASVYQLNGFTKEEADELASRLEAIQTEMLGVKTPEYSPPDQGSYQNSANATQKTDDLQSTRSVELANTVHQSSGLQSSKATDPVELPIYSPPDQGTVNGDSSSPRARVLNTKKEYKKINKKTQAFSADQVSDEVHAQFNQFWLAFPKTRRGGKTPALRMFSELVEGTFVSNPANSEPVRYPKVSGAMLLKCARCYAASLKDLQFASGVAAWFNDGKWEQFEDWEDPHKPKFILDKNGKGVLMRKPVPISEQSSMWDED